MAERIAVGINSDQRETHALEASEMPVVILAGGAGTRIREVTKGSIPKALIELAPGVTVIDQLLDGLAELGFQRFIFCLGLQSDQLIRHLDIRNRPENSLYSYSVEPQPLGTGGAIKLAIESWDITSPFLLITSDAIFPYSKIPLLLENHKTGVVTWAVSSSAVPEMHEHWTYLVDRNSRAVIGNSKFVWITEKRKAEVEEKGIEISVFSDGGHGVIDPLLFLKQYHLLSKLCGKNEKVCLYTEILPMLAEENRRRLLRGQQAIFFGLDQKEPIIDIGKPDRLLRGIEWYKNSGLP